MSMSRNSLDSKTSRHSMHSTYSASSARATTWTRRCRHGWSMDLLCGKFGVRLAGWLTFITSALTSKGTGGIFRYCRPEPSVVKLFQQTGVLNLGAWLRQLRLESARWGSADLQRRPQHASVLRELGSAAHVQERKKKRRQNQPRIGRKSLVRRLTCRTPYQFSL